MKKASIILAFAFALLVIEKAQAQLSIHVDYAPELITSKTATQDTTCFYHGLCFGLDWKFNLTNNLSLTSGAQYRTNLKDTSKHYWKGTFFIHQVTRERQALIDIPILLNYCMELSEKAILSPFAGPMLSWGIEGKTTETITYPGNAEKHQEWYGDNGHMNLFNVYATAGIKLEYGQLNFSIGGRYGLLELDKRNTGTIKASGLFVGIGYSTK